MNFFKGFTLIELLIVIAISGMLMGVLFSSYTKITQVSAKIQHEKIVAEEYLYLYQALHNIMEVSQISFENYTGEDALLFQSGYTDILYLTGGLGPVELYQTGETCYDYTGNNEIFAKKTTNAQCRLQASMSGENLQLTNPDKIYISNTIFHLSPQKYYSGNIIQYFDSSEEIQSQGVSLYTRMHINNWKTDWVRNVMRTIVLNYNL